MNLIVHSCRKNHVKEILKLFPCTVKSELDITTTGVANATNFFSISNYLFMLFTEMLLLETTCKSENLGASWS